MSSLIFCLRLNSLAKWSTRRLSLRVSISRVGIEKDERDAHVFATQVGIAACRLDFENAMFHSEQGDVEGTAAQIDDEDLLLLLGHLVETISDGSGGGLVDDAKDFETGDGAGVLGGLTLAVVEAVRAS